MFEGFPCSDTLGEWFNPFVFFIDCPEQTSKMSWVATLIKKGTFGKRAAYPEAPETQFFL